MASLPRNKRSRFYDVVVQVAIIRPGPIVGKMMHPYMRRRQKREPVSYPHPSLEPVLRRTLGVPLFQEQLLRIAMTVANFTGAEAEELRRAVGMRRSWERMKNLEGKLRDGMTANGLDAATQENIVQNISSFALYGFPESHAASFALIAYASAYLKVKYLAAFTCAILNNQPMGFYSAAVLVKDAQRHGLRVKPMDVQVSDWACTLEHEEDGSLSLRLGLGYAKGLRRYVAEAIAASRAERGAFHSMEDLVERIPLLNRKEGSLLARVGALNSLEGVAHRRDALWQVERAGRPEGPLLRNPEVLREQAMAGLPLQQMSTEERLVADYAGSGLTIGKHPMAYRRAELRREKILSAAELRLVRDGEYVRTAGCVIARQRPGTAMGFIFLSMEDETGIANVIVTPDLYDRQRLVGDAQPLPAGRRAGAESRRGYPREGDAAEHVVATRTRTALTRLSLSQCGSPIKPTCGPRLWHLPCLAGEIRGVPSAETAGPSGIRSTGGTGMVVTARGATTTGPIGRTLSRARRSTGDGLGRAGGEFSGLRLVPGTRCFLLAGTSGAPAATAGTGSGWISGSGKPVGAVRTARAAWSRLISASIRERILEYSINIGGERRSRNDAAVPVPRGLTT